MKFHAKFSEKCNFAVLAEIESVFLIGQPYNILYDPNDVPFSESNNTKVYQQGLKRVDYSEDTQIIEDLELDNAKPIYKNKTVKLFRGTKRIVPEDIMESGNDENDIKQSSNYKDPDDPDPVDDLLKTDEDSPKPAKTISKMICDCGHCGRCKNLTLLRKVLSSKIANKDQETGQGHRIENSPVIQNTNHNNESIEEVGTKSPSSVAKKSTVDNKEAEQKANTIANNPSLEARRLKNLRKIRKQAQLGFRQTSGGF